MIVVQINATCSSGSTGKICVSVSKLLTENGIENYILYNNGISDYELSLRCSTDFQIKAAALESRVMGNWGFEGRAATKKLISELERIDPDIVHLHNLHSHGCNLSKLFIWLKQRNKKVYWTFHDCWAFTGYCMHYEMTGCERWKSECARCPQKKAFSWIFDRSGELQRKKKELFSGVDLTIITPSNWLADQVKESFLRGCPVRVIHNGINLDTFKPASSDFADKYNISGNRIVLGVSMIWSERKGIDVFNRLAKHLPENYRIVLIGSVDNSVIADNIISIKRTANQKELAQIYSAADVFVNPTREDTFPTVNLESLACGTPVITFNTGGSPECIDDTCGSVVDKNDVDALEREIIRICEEKPYSSKSCVDRAKLFDSKEKFSEYLNLYSKN